MVALHAYFETEATRAAFEAAFGSALLSHHAPQLRPGGIAAACEFYARNPSPALLAIESNLAREDLFASLEALAESCEPHTMVVLLGAANDVALYRALVQKGVRDYLPLPVAAENLAATLGEIMGPAYAGAPKGKIIACFGATGGAGSSSLAQNLAWHLANRRNIRTALLDFDLTFGSVGLAFDLEAASPISNLVAQPERLDGMLIEGMAARDGDNLLLLTTTGDLQAVREPTAAASQKLTEAAARNAAATILDLPHEWNEWTRELLGLADQLIITVTPTLIGLRNLKAIGDALKPLRLGKAAPAILLNHCGMNAKTEVDAAHFKKALDGATLFSLAHDAMAFQSASNNGEMIAERFPKHKAVVLFDEIATHVMPAPTNKTQAKQSPFKALLSSLRLEKA